MRRARCVQSSVSFQGSGGSGGLKRSSPTGGRAYGTPRQRTASASAIPATGPLRVTATTRRVTTSSAGVEACLLASSLAFVANPAQRGALVQQSKVAGVACSSQCRVSEEAKHAQAVVQRDYHD